MPRQAATNRESAIIYSRLNVERGTSVRFRRTMSGLRYTVRLFFSFLIVLPSIFLYCSWYMHTTSKLCALRLTTGKRVTDKKVLLSLYRDGQSCLVSHSQTWMGKTVTP